MEVQGGSPAKRLIEFCGLVPKWLDSVATRVLAGGEQWVGAERESGGRGRRVPEVVAECRRGLWLGYWASGRPRRVSSGSLALEARAGEHLSQVMLACQSRASFSAQKVSASGTVGEMHQC